MSHTQNILEALRVMPNLTVPDLIELVPDCKPASLSGILNNLVRGGKVQVVGTKPNPNPKAYGRNRTLSMYALGDGRAKKKPPTDVAVKISQLEARITELEMWKMEAIERYPDLAVDPLTMRAREIVASKLDAKQAAEVRAGRKDDCPIMLAVKEALSERVYDDHE